MFGYRTSVIAVSSSRTVPGSLPNGGEERKVRNARLATDLRVRPPARGDSFEFKFISLLVFIANSMVGVTYRELITSAEK